LCFAAKLFTYLLNDTEMVPVALIITGITLLLCSTCVVYCKALHKFQNIFGYFLNRNFYLLKLQCRLIDMFRFSLSQIMISSLLSLSVVQWSKSADEQGVLCTIITRMFIDHIRIIVHMDISFLLVRLKLYVCNFVCIMFVILWYCVCSFCVMYCFECVCVILCFLCIVLYCVL
jgi:hypothetical protein